MRRFIRGGWIYRRHTAYGFRIVAARARDSTGGRGCVFFFFTFMKASVATRCHLCPAKIQLALKQEHKKGAAEMACLKARDESNNTRRRTHESAGSVIWSTFMLAFFVGGHGQVGRKISFEVQKAFKPLKHPKQRNVAVFEFKKMSSGNLQCTLVARQIALMASTFVHFDACRIPQFAV